MARVLVALGGNAIQRSGDHGRWDESVRRMRATVPVLAGLAAAGHELILTHGNGPQVGALLRQNELGVPEVPQQPLDVLGAESEGEIGYLIQQELEPALRRRKIDRTVVTIVSRVEVSRKDPAFLQPSKPVGHFYSASQAEALHRSLRWTLKEDAGKRGWRRVVPSPKPRRWVEGRAVERLLKAGLGRHWVPVVAGGGGIPVVRARGGRQAGVDAVIDKDLTASLVAREIRADVLAIVTDVPAAAVGFGTPAQRWLGEISGSELARYYGEGQFAEGSMRPKVEAVLEFMRAGGERALITDIPSLKAALAGRAGTRVQRVRQGRAR
jgi:carbamate kinase